MELQPVLERGGMIASKTIGPISTSWFAGAPSQAVLSEIAGMLMPLLRSAGNYPEPTLVPPAEIPVFVEGAFDDRGTRLTNRRFL